jgi:hypothetical protein
MADDHNPDGTFPSFPLKLVEDGEVINFNSLWKSGSADRGVVSKLINAVGYLYKRSPQLFTVSTNGSGGVSFTRRTPGPDGSTAFFSGVAFNGTTGLRCTFATPLASLADGIYQVSAFNPGDGVPYISAISTTYVEIALWDISAAALKDLTVVSASLYLTVYPNLAGMT